MYDDRSTGSLSDSTTGSTCSDGSYALVRGLRNFIPASTSDRYNARAAIANAQREHRSKLPVHNTILGGIDSEVLDGANNTIIGQNIKVAGNNNIVLGRNQTVLGNNNVVLVASDSVMEHKGDNMVILSGLSGGSLGDELTAMRKEMAQMKEMIEALQYAPPSKGGPLFQQSEVAFLDALKATQSSPVLDVAGGTAAVQPLSDSTEAGSKLALPLDADR